MPTETTLANLISNTTQTTLYESLALVDQDNGWVSLEQHPNGLYSDGFATCFAIIVRNINDPKKIALAHVSSIGFDVDDDIDFFEEMIEAVRVTGEDVTIELARSVEGYTTDYNFALIQLEDGTIINRNPDNPTAAEYFAEADETYQQFFATHFDITPVIHNMQAGMLVINHQGKVDYLKPHLDGEIEVDEFDAPQNKRQCRVSSSSSHLSFWSGPDSEAQEEVISSKRPKTGSA
ncbi:MAG TPA: hypothetical protein DDY37_04085 [Legionella sp.]|nr:hypothetical protein [Legionella sp.]